MKILYHNFKHKTVHNSDVWQLVPTFIEVVFQEAHQVPQDICKKSAMFYFMHSPPICSSPKLHLKSSLKAPIFFYCFRLYQLHFV